MHMQTRTKKIIWHFLLFVGISPLFFLIYCDISAYAEGMRFFEIHYEGWEAVKKSTVLFFAFFWKFVFAGTILTVISLIRISMLKHENRG